MTICWLVNHLSIVIVTTITVSFIVTLNKDKCRNLFNVLSVKDKFIMIARRKIKIWGNQKLELRKNSIVIIASLWHWILLPYQLLQFWDLLKFKNWGLSRLNKEILIQRKLCENSSLKRVFSNKLIQEDQPRARSEYKLDLLDSMELALNTASQNSVSCK
jgi:hypothetical protein